MAAHILFTGFPGFIARRLVDRLVRKDPEARFTMLIEQRLRLHAERALEELEAHHPGLAGRNKLIEGDIAAPQLGLSSHEYDTALSECTHVWHLAAIYNLAVPAAIAYRVNVLGTANVLDFCQACKDLQRLDYVSTCYVAGDRTGEVLESELDEGQGFHNHYESTKCWAEMEVRRRADRIPVAVYRPAIVVGDSSTGATDKYDGPYFMLQLLLRLPPWVPVPNIGRGEAKVNMVPVDWLVDAMAHLWTKSESLGQTVQLADPRPHRARDVMAAMIESVGRKPLRLDLPVPVVQTSLALGAVRSAIRIPKETVVYFNHEVEFDTANQRRLLEDSGLRCPDFLSYLPNMVAYVKANPQKPFLDGRAF